MQPGLQGWRSSAEQRKQRRIPFSGSVAQSPKPQREVDAVRLQQLQVLVAQCPIACMGVRQTKLGTQHRSPMGIEALGEVLHGSAGALGCTLAVGIDQWQQCFGKAGQIPLRHGGLIAISVAAFGIDRTEHGLGVEMLHEGARAVIDGFAGNRHVVGVHDAMNETHAHPARHQRGLTLHHVLQKPQVLVGLVSQCRIVAGDGVVSQTAQQGLVTLCGNELERTHAQMACRHTCEDAPRQEPVAPHCRACGHSGQRARGRDTQHMHGLAHQVFAQHRTERSQAVSAA